MSIQFSIRNRLSLALTGMLVPLVIFAWVTHSVIEETIGHLEEILVDPIVEIDRAADVHENLNELRFFANEYVLYGRKGEPASYRHAARQFEFHFKILRQSPDLLPEQVRLLDLTGELWQQAQEHGKRVITAKNPVNNPGVMRALHLFQRGISEIDANISRVYQVAQGEFHQGARSMDLTRHNIRNLFALTFMVSVVILLLLAFWLGNSLLGPLKQLQDGVQKLAAGDFNQRVPEERTDEIGSLASSFNTMAESLGAARADLERLTMVDGLTGTLNRRAFEKNLDKEINRASRQNKPMSLIMVDIDHFKKINDDHGHLAGDDVLKKFATCVGGKVRPMDQFARYGGEEFAIILPEASKEDAINSAERLRNFIEVQTCSTGTGAVVDITASFGVATYPEDAGKSNELVAMADKRLYAAKAAGRNQVIGND